MNSAATDPNSKSRSNLVGQYGELRELRARATFGANRCLELQSELERLSEQSRQEESVLRQRATDRQQAAAQKLEATAAERLEQSAAAG
ncbi:MAG UNVERIFIED_CONTAM: hypothetical protein LVR18_36780 [Planctomycetaceae bacterium]